MFRLLVASLIASTGLIFSTVEASDPTTEEPFKSSPRMRNNPGQLEMMRNNQLQSLSSTGSTTTGNSPSSPAMFMSPNMGNNLMSAPEPPKPISICWVVDKETVCIGG